METGPALGRMSGTPSEGGTPTGTVGHGSGTSSSGVESGPPPAPSLELPSIQRPRLRETEQPWRRRWGYSDPQGTIGFERDVAAYVDGSQIMIGSQSIAADDVPQEELVKHVLNAVELHTRTWGQAPKNFYWVPTLRFRMGAGGERQYERIRPSLNQWGLSSTVEPYVASPQPAPGRQLR